MSDSTPTPAASHDDTSGAYAQALFLATFPAGHTPVTDTRTPADLGLAPV
jgi:hypothetical protein